MKMLFAVVFLSAVFSFDSTFAQRTISFSGIEWYVKAGFYGPGPNYWSDSKQNVWVDAKGFLHLKIRKAGGEWRCSEIYSVQEFGYGEFTFQVASNLEKYPGNVMVGLFVYENDNSEIDIEFANRKSGRVLGWYAVQDSNRYEENCDNFSLNLTGDYSTHKFSWNKQAIIFQSYHGHADSLPSAGHLINEWIYKGHNIPREGNERLRINFWLNSGNEPLNEKELELIIKSVDFKPASGAFQNYSKRIVEQVPFNNFLKY